MSADLGSPIMLIRHAEKPQPGEQGVGLDGRPDERGLAVKGWARAGALVGLFAPDARLRLPGLARPGRLVAASCGDRRRSSRPRDTLALLAAALDLPIELYDDDKASLRTLAESLSRSPCAVLVSWRHGSLPTLASALLQQTDGAPARWPGDRFDLVWAIERDGLRRRLLQVPQRLLAGDQGQPIKAVVPCVCKNG
jgi:hypothetical protein